MSDDMHCFRDSHAVAREVEHARLKAHAKHGENSIEVEPTGSPRWLAILVEEIGEVANALTYDGKGNLRAELIDVLAVASAWVDKLDAQPSFDIPALKAEVGGSMTAQSCPEYYPVAITRMMCVKAAGHGDEHSTDGGVKWRNRNAGGESL